MLNLFFYVKCKIFYKKCIKMLAYILINCNFTPTNKTNMKEISTPLNYSEVYPYFIKTLDLIQKNAIDNNKADDIYYGMKKFLNIAFEKCSHNSSYCNGWLIWFKGKRSTVHLRALMNEVGCVYWDSLHYSNIVDTLDSMQRQIIF